MSRRRKGRPIHGWVNLDKPANCSSARAVAKVRFLLDAAKAGHAGTLDPLATGVLPIALGEATKTVSFLQTAEKTYTFSVRWGEERDTGDMDGKVTAANDLRPSVEAVRAMCGAMTGEVEQVPPVYAAVKVGGRRAYDIVRSGGAVTLAPRRVWIKSLICTETPDRDSARFIAVCGKGTYIRSLARDLAHRLGVLGTVAKLRRERVGHLRAEGAISLENLEEVVHSPAPYGALLPVETALADIPALPLTGFEAQRLRQGQMVPVTDAINGTVCVTMAGSPVAVAHVEDGFVRPVRVFNI